MSENNQKLSFLVRRDQYLKLPKMPGFLVPMIIFLALLGLVTFLFFGRMAVTYTGVSYEVNDHAYLLVPYPYQEVMDPANKPTVWIGNEKGTVETLYTDRYMTYESIMDNNYFQVEGNPLIRKDMTYLLATAVFGENLPRTGSYKVLLETVRPIDMLLGGAQ